MASFVGGISQREPLNWARCKEVGLWGLPAGRFRGGDIKPGDRLFVWRSRAGFVAEAVFTGNVRVPVDRSEAPWPGGPRRFTKIIPMEVVVETEEPYRLNFVNDRQEVTGISTNSLRFGLAPITDEAGDHISAALRALSGHPIEQT